MSPPGTHGDELRTAASTSSPYRPAPELAPPRAHPGVKIALVVSAAAVVAVGALLAVRVVEAKKKEAEIVTARAAAAAHALVKEPVSWVSPVLLKHKVRVELTGTLKPWREADVGFETPGRLVSIGVSTGDVVKEGKVLAILDASRAGAQVSQAESQIRAAEANLALAEDNLRRTEALAASKSVAEASAEQARQQVALAKAQLDGARATTQLARSGAGLHSILAPVAGVVTRAPTGIGAVVAPGAPLVRLEDTSRFRLSATVGEEEASLLAVGAPVVVKYRDRLVTGRVIAIVPSLDQGTRRVPVEIEVPNDPAAPLLAWGFVRGVIEGKGEIDGLQIPAAAHRPGSQDEVVRLDGDKVTLVRVSRIVTEDGSWIVTRGLSPTDRIVFAPAPELRTGDVVGEATPRK